MFTTEWTSTYLSHLGDTDAMAVFLAKIRRSADSVWDAFVQLWPAEFPNSPIFFDDERTAQLQRSPVKDFAAKRLNRAQLTYAKLPAEVRELISESDFFWGLSVLWSRSHSVQVRDTAGTWHKAACFVPIADLMNTADTSLEDETNNADCRTNDDSTHFECFTTRQVKAGEEMLVPYGAADKGMGSGQLLLDYGFTPEQTQFDTVGVVMPPLRPIGRYDDGRVVITSDVYDLQEKLLKNALKIENITASQAFFVPLPAVDLIASNRVTAIPAPLLAYARIWNIDAATLPRIGSREKIAASVGNEAALLPAHEVRVVESLRRAVVDVVESYGTTVAEDKLLLADVTRVIEEGAEGHALESEVEAALVTRSILRLRMSEKRLLYLLLNILTHYQNKAQETASTTSTTRAARDEL